MHRQSLTNLSLRWGKAQAFVVIAILCLTWVVYSSVEASRRPERYSLRLAAGTTVDHRHQIAKHLAAEAKEAKVDITIVPISGLEATLTGFATRQIDAAIVSLGLQVRDVDHIQVLAGLDVAPLHILARRELTATNKSLSDIFKNHRVNIGPPGTNDHAMGIEVLDFLRVTHQCKARNWTKDELMSHAEGILQASSEKRQELAKELPDVALLVASLPSNVVQRLLDTGLYELVPFPYANNFLLSDPNGPTDNINRNYVEQAKIPAAMYVGSTPTPAVELPSIGLRSLLVAHRDVPAETVTRVMHTVFDSSFTHRIAPLPPNRIVDSIRTHDAAASYLQRQKPLITGDVFERFSDGLSIFGAFIAGVLSLYGYLRRRNVRSPGEYLEEIRHVDSLVYGNDSTDSNTLKCPALQAQELDSRLVKLKQKLIEDYCNNRVQGELVLMTILSMLSDSRAQIQRAAMRTEDSPKPYVVPTEERSRAA
jgi:TRAP-type uncharacterized transport system substrate-binding protein